MCESTLFGSKNERNNKELKGVLKSIEFIVENKTNLKEMTWGVGWCIPTNICTKLNDATELGSCRVSIA